MTFAEKRDAAVALLKARGVPRPAYAPTIVATAWKLGLEIPPPHFASPLGIIAFTTIVLGAAWGILLWIVVWSHNGVTPLKAIAMSAAFGLILGALAAVYFRRAARKLGLPRWKDFNPSSGPSGSMAA